MSLHRPVDLDSLNDGFFSPEGKEEPRVPEKKRSQRIIDTDSPESVIDALKDVEFSKSNSIFHDIPDYSQSGSSAGSSKDLSDTDSVFTNSVSKNESEKSVPESDDDFKDAFPDVEFDPDFFRVDPEEYDAMKKGNETEGKEQLDERKAIKEAKKKAKASINREKEMIKQQKKIEGTVQGTFSGRRTVKFITAVLIIIGILAGAFAGTVFAISRSESGVINLGPVKVGYIGDEKIIGPGHFGEIIVVKQSGIQGNCSVLFNSVDMGKYAFGDVIAFGDSIYAIDIVSAVIRVPYQSIVGVSRFSVKNMSDVYSFISTQYILCAIILAVYFVLIITVSTVIIKKFNKKIKRFQEEYELV